MSISAQSSYSSIKPDLRQGNRRSSDIEQQAYAAVGRRFATGASSRVRYVRIVLGAAACITVVMLVTLVALLTYDNINSPHALKVAAPAKPEPQPQPRTAGVALAARAKPVVIIDEKEEAPQRPVVATAPVPPLVLLSAAEIKPSAPPAPARIATAIKTPLKQREHAKPGAAGKQVALKTGKPVRTGARKELRNEPRKVAPSPVKRKASLASMAVPAQPGADGGALGTLLSYASVQRRYLAQPLPMLAARHAPRRTYLSEP